MHCMIQYSDSMYSIAENMPVFAMPSLVFAGFQPFVTELLHPCCAQGQALVLLSGVSVAVAAAAAVAAEVSTHNKTQSYDDYDVPQIIERGASFV
jgi:hypothetical protein